MRPVKICVPLAYGDINELKIKAAQAKEEGADLIEFRADYYKGDNYNEAAAAIKEISGLPVIFTLRHKDEGGAVFMLRDKRFKIINGASADYIDIEAANGDDFIIPLINAARERGVKTIVSSHNFKVTPDYASIMETLLKSASYGADVVKIAVMPNGYKDVLTLLNAAVDYSLMPDVPSIIAVSMGEMGKISRIAAGMFSAFLTFACLDIKTAPGQISICELKGAVASLDTIQPFAL